MFGFQGEIQAASHRSSDESLSETFPLCKGRVLVVYCVICHYYIMFLQAAE